MTSGSTTQAHERRAPRWRAPLLAAALALAAHGAWAIDLPGLMSLLAQRKGGSARFTEERTVSNLDGPLYSSGTLSFEAPDRFERQTLEPRQESMAVQGNRVVLRRGGRTRQLSLDAVPELAAFVDALRGTLSGDAAMLQRHFRVVVAGSAVLWTLTLTPRDETLERQVRELQIAGQGSSVRSIELRLVGGDRSLMLIDPPDAAAGASAAAAEAAPRAARGR
jgi:hypothetical protein